ncbi:MAG: FAD-dependent oxidoreductase [Nodosilinea sp.]
MFGAGAIAGLIVFRMPAPVSTLPSLLALVTMPQPTLLNGRPRLYPQPVVQETWECQVVVVGGSLGGIAAAAHAMATGAQTCLIEVAPWMGGQISSQGVSALDESLRMRQRHNFSPTWLRLRRLIGQQVVTLPIWMPGSKSRIVATINSCWVGTLCFPPIAGHLAAEQFLAETKASAPGSRWSAMTAFKGAGFDASGRHLTAIYAVRRIPKDPHYIPKGRLSEELADWYSWSPTQDFDRVPIKLQPPPRQSMMVIDATDTGELVGWARLPYRMGSEARSTIQEPNGADFDNPQCTQAFTYPFSLGIYNDDGDSLAVLARLQPTYNLQEHNAHYSLVGFPFLTGKGLFQYRRIVSQTRHNPYRGSPSLGDISLINWNQGNDWNWMNPPLILSDRQLGAAGQYQNWMGGLSQSALKFAEENALMFARWLLTTQSSAAHPLTYLYGSDSPLGSRSGLSMVPYVREGRRILGRSAYGQNSFMIRENDLRYGFLGQRDFSPTAVAMHHYAIDIHGCRYRNWLPSGDAVRAPAREDLVKPLAIPLESLIPQGVDNLLIGGKAIAVSHIANGSTRIHYGEWQIGAAAGVTAGWLVSPTSPVHSPPEIIPQGYMGSLQAFMVQQGLKLTW